MFCKRRLVRKQREPLLGHIRPGPRHTRVCFVCVLRARVPCFVEASQSLREGYRVG